MRMERGQLGDCRHVGDGVHEARLMCGPGYRLYFGRVGRTIILLLIGGTKASQFRDIHRARSYWREFLEGR